MVWSPKATIALANDLVTASLVLEVGSDTRAAIQSVADVLISSALAADPTLAATLETVAIGKVDEAISTRLLVQAQAGDGWLQERFPDTGALGWKSDTLLVDDFTGTTLPGPATVTAMSKVGFPVAKPASVSTPGVGVGVRSQDGRPTVLETADTFDETTGVVPGSLRAQIAAGLVTAHHVITGAALAALVPAGRFVLHEQADGLHLIMGEKNA